MDNKKIKKVKVIDSIQVHLLKEGDVFKKTFMYLGTIVAKVRFKLRPSGLNKNEYLLPVEIISASKEDGYYYKGQIVDLIIKPRRSKFTEVSLVEIKYFKDKK
tara:strand:+ start:3488 stop:3796 length:309 start_codon:yes stop_codon:yes gene_type:complete